MRIVNVGQRLVLLDASGAGGPPPGWAGWPEWAAERWPSLADD